LEILVDNPKRFGDTVGMEDKAMTKKMRNAVVTTGCKCGGQDTRCCKRKGA
jgi:hypothetical protein